MIENEIFDKLKKADLNVGLFSAFKSVVKDYKAHFGYRVYVYIQLAMEELGYSKSPFISQFMFSEEKEILNLLERARQLFNEFAYNIVTTENDNRKRKKRMGKNSPIKV